MNKFISIKNVWKYIAKVEKAYPIEIFSEPKKGSAPDCFTAAGARLACELIRQEIVKHATRNEEVENVVECEES